MNPNPIIPVIFSDLQAWEKEGLEPLFESLENHFGVKRQDVARGRSVTLPKEGTLWVFSNDWRAALRRIKPSPQKTIYLSVLDHLSVGGWLPSLFLKKVRPASNPFIHLIAHSQLSYRFLREMQQVPENQISLIPLPFSKTLPEKKGSPNSSPTVGMISRWATESNVNYFLTVAHYIHTKDSRIRFNIVGKGPLETHIRKMVQELELSDVVEIFESNDCGVTDFNCLIFPSLQSLHFIPLVLAAGAGVPVLANEMGGVEDFIEDGKDGFVVPINEVKGMAELAIRLVQDRIFSSAIAEKYREKFAQKYAPEMWLKDLENLLLGKKLVVGLSADQKAA